MSASTIEVALRAACPGADETLLLRALLLPDARGAKAWSDFKAIHADLGELFRTDHGEWRRLSPLLSRNLKVNGADVDARLWTVLRMANMREDLRAKVYQQVLGEVVQLLTNAEVSFAVVRGAAVGALAYGDVSARHSHDIDLLVSKAHVNRAMLLLESNGYAREGGRPMEAGQSPVQSVVHATSLPVRIHTFAFEFTGYALDPQPLLANCAQTNLGGIDAPTLSAEAMLVQAVVHASYSPTRYTLQWVADVVKLAPLVSNWPTVVELARAAKATIATHALLTYVNEQIADIVPAEIINDLRESSSRATPFERDLALYGVRMGARRGVSALFDATPSVVDRAVLAKWLALPSADYLQWSRESRASITGPEPQVGRATRLIRRISNYLRVRSDSRK